MSGHRGYVGPKTSFDLIAALTFNLLTTNGLRETHSVLDIGCGCLRIGRLLIPYLDRGKYVGIEPNKWLIEAAIEEEVGRDILEIKEPKFIISDFLREGYTRQFDYIFAQSIFTHAGIDIIEQWFYDISNHLKQDGKFFFTYFEGKETGFEGWEYPGRINHSFDLLADLADRFKMTVFKINWKHPHDQQWAQGIKN